MISILWYSLCNFIAGFSPSFYFLLFWRALLGIGMEPNGRSEPPLPWNPGLPVREVS